MVLGTVRSMGYQVVEDTLPPEPLKIEVWVLMMTRF
jgi:hypothetical protein